jgi:hypothetical protein
MPICIYECLNLNISSSNWESDVRLPVAVLTTSSEGHHAVSCLSLLEVTAATGTMTLAARGYYSRDGQIMLWCLWLLDTIVVTGG